METLPVGWTVHTCDHEGDGAELLKGGSADVNANTHVHDLFHEDAQVRHFPHHLDSSLVCMDDLCLHTFSLSRTFHSELYNVFLLKDLK